MKYGAHTFLWEPEWGPGNARRAIGEAARAGFDLIEIPLLSPQAFDAKDTRELLGFHGLEGTFSLGLPREASLPDNPDGARDFLDLALDRVAVAGGSVLTGVPYATLGESPRQRPQERDLTAIATCLSRVARRAASLGIELGLEPVNRYVTSLLNTAEQAVAMVERIGEPNVFVHLDTCHMNLEEESFGEAIRLAGPKLKYIHLSESHRGTPGTGTVDWDDVFEGLEAIGYAGPLVMQAFGALPPAVARAACMWRDIVTDPERLAAEGLAFLRGKARQHGLPG